MGVHTALREHLAEWSGSDTRRAAVAQTIVNLAEAGAEIARLIAQGPLAGDMAVMRGTHAQGTDTQKELDFLTHEMVMKALKKSPVAWVGSEEDADPLPLNEGAPLAVMLIHSTAPPTSTRTLRSAPSSRSCPPRALRHCFSRGITSLQPVLSFTDRKQRSC